MAHALDGARAKVARAKQLFPEAYRLWADFSEADEPAFGVHTYSDYVAGRSTLVWHVARQPVELSVVTGEILHNLRSALDHIAWAFVWFKHGQPGTHTVFPLCPTSQAWQDRVVTPLTARGGRRSPLEGLSPGDQFWSFIEARQPFEDPEGGQILLQLARLNNIDKHRTLLPAAVAPDLDALEAAISYEGEHGTTTMLKQVGSIVRDGEPFAVVTFPRGVEVPDVRIEARIPMQIVFEDDQEPGAGPDGDFESMYDVVFRTVEAAATFIPEDPSRSIPHQAS